MRSTLVKKHRRSCPQCGCYGFARTGEDFYGNTTFECNDCRHEWSAERGPKRGTSLHRISENMED